MRPPSWVYLAALLSRLAMTWPSRTKSPDTQTGAAGTDTAASAGAPRSAAAPVSTPWAITFAELHLLLLERDPCPGRCATRRAARPPAAPGGRPGGPSCRSPCASFGSGGARRRMTSIAARIGASGLRSSCESIAMNSSLRRFASSAARRAASACASATRSSAIMRVLLLELVELDEHLDLAAQDLRQDRRQDVVHRAERVALGRLHLVGVGGDEDDRRVRRLLVLADERRGFQPVDVRHVDVEQDDRELALAAPRPAPPSPSAP